MNIDDRLFLIPKILSVIINKYGSTKTPTLKPIKITEVTKVCLFPGANLGNK
ncbi:hypothetical protein OEOE_0133 [Oenococcus oeni PSU-1]|uniref:Uncharacterized protein n=1 Tax=Oenococcus oeni (strain ATCC BAA-331 / PSU-1) TaxID=203123 RepID=Q04HE5_OENOB|nr:hypothetical protein OEOE_0133 [Oenococcus oeni PSU-1]